MFPSPMSQKTNSLSSIEHQKVRVLTPEQLDIINTNFNIRINAVAGSGKTTTIIEYAGGPTPKFKNLIPRI